MESKQITPEEGLQVINKLFDQTRINTYRYAYPPCLVWGYLTFVWVLALIHLEPYWSNIWMLWYLFPILGFLLTWILKPKKKMAQTQLQRVVNTLWIVIGVALVAVNFSPAVINHGLNAPLTLIMLGAATAIQGFSLRMRIFEVSSLLLIITGLVLLYTRSIPTFWVWHFFAFAFLLGEAIPGHLMYREVKKTL